MKSILNNILRIIKKIPAEIYIFIIAVLYRLPTLGYDFINNDAYHWKERGYAFGAALTSLDPAATAVTYHPGIPLLWSQFIAIKLYTLLDMALFKGSLEGKELFLVNHQIQKVVLVLISSVLIALIYNVLKKIIGSKASIIAVVLVLLEPFYIGLSRAVHTDALLSLFMILSILYYYRSLKVVNSNNIYKNWNLIITGLFLGLALLTKSSALFLIPFMGLVSIYFSYIEKNKKPILNVLYSFLIAAITFVLLWPAMWIKPIDSLDLYVNRGVQGVALEEGHGHIWFGIKQDKNLSEWPFDLYLYHFETRDPGATFYPVVFLTRYSEFLVIAFFIAVAYFGYKKLTSRDLDNNNIDYNFVLVNLAYILFYILMITLVSKKLDRYSLPILFPVATIVGIYLVTVLKTKWLAFTFLILLIYRSVLFIGFHPNYLAYYNPIFGGAEHARYLVEPKWLIGYNEVAEYFNKKQEEKDRKLKVAIADFDYLEPFAKFEVLNIKHEVERDEAEFFVLPVYRTERNQFYLNNYNLEKLNDEIKVAGVEYYEIYVNRGKNTE